MVTKSSRQAAQAPESTELATLAKLAGSSYETLERELRATIATLEQQALRFETAIDNISQGICFFDAAERLILCNRRYAEIYRIAPEHLRPGRTLGEIVERRIAAGTSAMASDAYLAFARAVNSGTTLRNWTANLTDGRTIQICHQPMPDGGWVATHEDITELTANRLIVDERISLQTLIDWVPDYLWVKDTESRFVVANRAIASDSGKAKTSDMIGLTDSDLHAPDLAQKFRAIEQGVLRSGQPMIDEEEFVVDASGAGKWFSSTKVPLRNVQNDIFGLVGIAHDITARKQADTLRDGQAQILEMIATSAPLEDVLDCLMRLAESQLTGIFGSVLLLDKDGSHLRHGAAPSLAKAYTSAIEGIAVGPKMGSCGTAAYRREPVIVADIMHDPLWQDHCELAAAHGYRSCWSTPILSHQGAVLGAFAMYSTTVREPTAAETRLIDFTTRIAGIAIERKLAEDRIHFMANHDVLTGLPNRALLEDRLSQAILYAQRYDRWVTVVFIDLDNFKLVNDTLGHNAGDELLKTVAGRIVERVRATDTVVRLGGDEFVVVLFDQPTNVDLISETLQAIRAAIAEPVQLGAHRLRATASIGIASYPKDGANPDTLLANADAAMYRAKEFGRDNFQFYAPEFNTRAHEKFVLQEDLRNALGPFGIHAVLSAAGRPSVGPRLCRRSAASLESSDAGHDGTERLHSDGRGDKSDRAGRRLGPARGLSAEQGMAGCRPAADDRLRECVDAAIQGKEPDRPCRRCPESQRSGGQISRAGGDRKPDHAGYRPGGRNDESAAKPGRSDLDRRFRNRLLQPQCAQDLSSGAAENRQVVHQRYRC